MLEQIIISLQSLSPEYILTLEYITCFVAILALVRFFGAAGLFTYISLAVVIANIQVQKTVSFSFLNFPVALGTIVFSSTFIAVDILNEFYGVAKARRAVWIGFMSSLLVTLLMVLTLGTLPGDDNSPPHQAMKILFMPIPAIFIASLSSYLICQRFDIWIFCLIRKLTGGKYLWLRTSLASITSSLLDNIIFSLLAFVVLAPNPISIDKLIYTYILGTYIFRIIVSILQTPIIYFIRTLLKSGKVLDE